MKRVKEELKIKGYKIFSYIWKNDDIRTKGTVQIFHGMAEHILRYEPFIEKLVDEGYTVIGHDHVAHGLSTKKEKIGVLENKDFMNEVLDVCKGVYEHYKKEYISGATYLFSHSMGSMAAHRYIEIYPNDFNKVILCGTDISSIKYSFGLKVFKSLIKKHGEISYPALLDSLTMKPFNAKFKNDHPDYGWLSVNKENIKAYAEDSLCGAKFPTNYYYSLASLITETGKKENLELINKDLKVLLLSGKEDPVTNYSKSTVKLHRRFKKIGIDVVTEIYYNARHEILNEKNEVKNLVIEDIINFYNK